MQEIADPTSHITSSICQLYAVLAIASAHLPGLMPTSEQDRSALVNFDSGEPDFPGMAFFARAYLLLPSLVQDASIRSVTTLALVVSVFCGMHHLPTGADEQAYYLLSVSHRDAAYCYVSHTCRSRADARSAQLCVYRCPWACIIPRLHQYDRCSGRSSFLTGKACAPGQC